MSTVPAHDQTLKFLKRRFAEVGLRLNARHGQNFLIDLNLVRLLVETAAIDERDVVLEVGTGTGSLTALMAQRAAAVVTVEIDPQLHQLASEELIDFENVTTLHMDALKNKNTLNPLVLEAVRQRLSEAPDRRLRLVANLPYSVATPVISNLLATDTPPVSMTVTIQKELADRIVAAPATKDYGALSIWVQSQCATELVRSMPPTVFWPRPKVTSAIVQITLEPERRARISQLAFFHNFVRALFFHRRKFLRGVVLSACKGQLSKDDVDHVMAELQFVATDRAEELTVERMLELTAAVHARLPANDDRA